jgi:hypothetical protein
MLFGRRGRTSNVAGAMGRLTPQQLRRRDRIEGLIGLMAPFLDLVLAAGDRVSKLAGPPDDHYEVRGSGEPGELEAGGASTGADEAEPSAAAP